MERFGILSPAMGQRMDIPAVLMPSAFTYDNLNVRLVDGEVRRSAKPEKELIDASLDLVPVPDGNPILEMFFYEKNDGASKYLLAFTKANVYYWNGTSKDWERKWTCSGNASDWSVCQYADWCIATNYVDTPIAWNGTSIFCPLGDLAWSVDQYAATSEYETGTVTTVNDSATVEGAGTTWKDGDNVVAGDIIYIATDDRAYVIESVTDNDTLVLVDDYEGTSAGDKSYVVWSNAGLEYATGEYLTKAKYCISFENYLVFAHTLQNGFTYPYNLVWNDAPDLSDWNTGNAGETHVGEADGMSGLGIHQDFLIVFKNRSFYRYWLVASSLVFNGARMSERLGTFAPHSIRNGENGELYFFANDFTIRAITGSLTQFDIISTPYNKLLRAIPDTYVPLIRSVYIERYGETWWAIPYGAEETQNNYIIAYKGGAWTKQDTAISAFATYEHSSGMKINTIPYPTINSIPWDTINQVDVKPGFRPNIGADYSGNVYRLNAAMLENQTEDYTGYFVLTTDFTGSQYIDYYKRLVKLEVFYRPQPTGTLTVAIAKDFDETFVTFATIAMTGTADMASALLSSNTNFRAKNFQVKTSAAAHFEIIGVIFYFQVHGKR